MDKYRGNAGHCEGFSESSDLGGIKLFISPAAGVAGKKLDGLALFCQCPVYDFCKSAAD